MNEMECQLLCIMLGLVHEEKNFHYGIRFAELEVSEAIVKPCVACGKPVTVYVEEYEEAMAQDAGPLAFYCTGHFRINKPSMN